MDIGDIIGLVLGWVGGWLTSRWYHRLAIEEGEKSTGQLLTSDESTRRLVNTIGHALRNAGFDIPFDADGNMSRVVKGKAHASFTLSPRAEGIVPAPPVYDRAHEQPPVESTET